MKFITILFLTFASFNLFGQIQLVLGETFPDSISVLKSCKWEVSIAKFTDTDGSKYQVFLDTEKNEAFMIFRKREKFVQVWIK